MPVYVTFREAVMPKDAFGFAMALPGNQLGDSDTLAVSGSADSTATAAPRDCIAEIETTENCRFARGVAGAASATSQPLLAARGFVQIAVRQGEFVSVIAL